MHDSSDEPLDGWRGRLRASLTHPKLLEMKAARPRGRRRRHSRPSLTRSLCVRRPDELDAWLAGTAQEAEPPVVPLGLVVAVECGHRSVWAAEELLHARWRNLPMLVTSRAGPRDLRGFEEARGFYVVSYVDSATDQVAEYVVRMRRRAEIYQRTAARMAGWYELTEREHEVVLCRAYGATRRQTATVLEISLGTVADHMTHIRSKCDIRERGGLINRLNALAVLEGAR